MVSDERIAEIRERLSRASDGPWTAPGYSGLIDGPAYVGVVNLTGFRRFYDADFVAHSRSDVPYLLDALAAAQAEIAALKAERDALRLDTMSYLVESNEQRHAALARAEAAEAEAARLRAALEVAAVRFGICAGRMRACHSETGNHELLDEVEMFASETRAILAGDRGAVLGDDSRESSIAHKWARAAFTLAHFENDTEDTAQLKQAVRDFWAPMDYSKDEDEIMRVAILLAIQEVRQRVRRERED